jgi:hypothetical protein
MYELELKEGHNEPWKSFTQHIATGMGQVCAIHCLKCTHETWFVMQPSHMVLVARDFDLELRPHDSMMAKLTTFISSICVENNCFQTHSKSLMHLSRRKEVCVLKYRLFEPTTQTH